MKSKSRILVIICTLILCIGAFSITAFAGGGNYFESDENNDVTPPEAIFDITINTEGIKLPENQGNVTLTPSGNLTLIDDILQGSGYFVTEEQKLENKQFITLQSKNGNYFYLVIDRSGDTENVYFLNLVDESDLLALMEEKDEVPTPTCNCKDKCTIGAVKTDCEVCCVDMKACVGKENIVPIEDIEKPEPDEKESSNGIVILVVLLLLGGGGFAVYWFKFKKPKPETKGEDDLDDYDYSEDDDEDYETEDSDEE